MFAVHYIWLVLKMSGMLFFRGILPYILAALLIQFLSDRLRKRLADVLGRQIFVFVTAPGVVVHELSHAAACIIFRHSIAEMCLFSPRDDGTLGYVIHTYDPSCTYQRIGNFFIGVAPIIGGVSTLSILSSLLLPDNIAENFFVMLSSKWFWSRCQTWLWFYASICVASHVTLSEEDLHGAADGVALLVGVILLFELLTAWDTEMQMVISTGLSRLFIVSLPSLVMSVVLMSVLLLILSLGRKR